MKTKLFHRSILLVALSLAPLILISTPVAADPPEFNRPLARPWLGIILGASDGTGVEVDLVLRTSPAHEAELRAGDRVIAIDGERVRSAGKLLALVRGKRINATVEITVRRGEEILTRSMKLPSSPPPNEVARRHLVGAPAPSHNLESAGGDARSADALEGTPYLIDFWATWCQACKLAEPRIAQIAARYGERLRVMTVSDEEPEVVRTYLQNNDARHAPVYLDSERSLTEAMLVRALPTYVFVDADGRVAEVAFGVDELDRLAQAIARALPPADAPSDASKPAEPTSTSPPERPPASPGEDAAP